MQKAAIEYDVPTHSNQEIYLLTRQPREQEQLARENPIAAAAAAAAAGGSGVQNNVENLLDIDFDGAAPASLQGQQPSGSSGLEDLMGDSRPAAPAAGNSAAPATTNNIDDLMGLFGGESVGAGGQQVGLGSGSDDVMNGFGSLAISGSGSQAKGQTAQKQTNEDILGLF
jgi:AP-1 complex subunit beta-1